MSETDPSALLPGQAGEPAPAGSSDPAAGGGDDRPLTQADLQTFRTGLLGEIDQRIAGLQTAAQSLADKGDARVLRKVQGEIQRLTGLEEQVKRAGGTLSPEVLEKMRANALFDGLAGSTEPPPGGKAPEPEAPKPAEGLPFDPTEPAAAAALAASAIMDEIGVKLTPADPEWKLLDSKATSTKVWLDSFQTALNAKIARLAGKPPESPEPGPAGGGGAGALPGTGRGTPPALPAGLSAMDYLSMGYEQNARRREGRS